MVREAEQRDLDAILELYLFLHEDSIPEKDEHLRDTWLQIIQDPNHHLIVNEVGGKIISSCVCVIIPNLTRNIRPYAFVENVVTREDYREKGYASECLEFARQIAEKENCYRNDKIWKSVNEMDYEREREIRYSLVEPGGYS